MKTGRHDDRLVLRITGDLDLATAPALEEKLNAARADGVPRVVLDLAELRFLDSHGLGLLLQAHRRAADGGPDIAVRNPPAQARRLFDLAGVADYLTIEDGEPG